MNSPASITLWIVGGTALGAAALSGSDTSAHGPQQGQTSSFAWADFDADGHRDAFVVAADGTTGRRAVSSGRGARDTGRERRGSGARARR